MTHESLLFMKEYCTVYAAKEHVAIKYHLNTYSFYGKKKSKARISCKTISMTFLQE